MVTPVLFMHTKTFDMLQLILQSMSHCITAMKYRRACQMETHEVHKNKRQRQTDRPPYVRL